MGVNTMGYESAYTLLNSIVNQATAEPSAPAENAVMQEVNDVLAKMDRKLTELEAANIYNQQMPTEQPHAMKDVEALEELIRPHTRDN